MRELCERPGIKCPSIPSTVNLVNASVHAVFDGTLLPHADKNNNFATSFV